MLARLFAAIQAVCPIEGLWHEGPGGAYNIQFKSVATPQQQNAAHAVVNNFDWSEAAHQTWLLGQRRLAAKAVFDDALDAQNQLVRALGITLLDEINILRNQHSLAPRTKAQLRTAIRNKIDAGDAD